MQKQNHTDIFTYSNISPPKRNKNRSGEHGAVSVVNIGTSLKAYFPKMVLETSLKAE